jgi:hypothetical protein
MKMMMKTKQTKEMQQQHEQVEDGAGETIVELEDGAIAQCNHRSLQFNHSSNHRDQHSNHNHVERVMLLWALGKELLQRARNVLTAVQVPFLLVW